MKALLAISVVLFILACGLPALEFKKNTGAVEVTSGGAALALGWLGLFCGIYAWCANFVWLYAIVVGFLGKAERCSLAGIVALAIGLTVFLAIGREIPGDEANVTRMALVRLLPGCCVWLASLAVLPAAYLLSKAR